ncbi:MAG: hypothetical protein IJ578_06980 [Bacteroidales bacterium]|nr:hypothetical protein [Bacteroidales bacterium]
MRTSFKLFLGCVFALTLSFSASAQVRPDRIELIHGTFYNENGQALSDAQVRSLFGDDIYHETYVGARQQFRSGRTLLTGGLVALGAGIACTVVAATSAETDDYGNWVDDSAYAGVYLGVLTMIAGGIAIDVGVPLMIIGTRRLAWMENEHNSRPAPAWSLSFRQTASGAGLVLSF